VHDLLRESFTFFFPTDHVSGKVKRMSGIEQQVSSYTDRISVAFLTRNSRDTSIWLLLHQNIADKHMLLSYVLVEYKDTARCLQFYVED
jgi:hypothetical protein